MVSIQCIVQSYLRWLEDSDYDAVCALCTQSLLQGEVIRLICYGECVHNESGKHRDL